MSNQTILFDFDGTLANTIPGILATLEATKQQMKVDFSLSLAQSLIGKPLVNMAPLLVGEERVGEFVNTYLEQFPAIGGEMVEFFPGVEPLIKALRTKGIIVGIVTSKRRDSLLQNLQKLKAEALFDFIVTNEDTEFHKPHPAPVEKALDLAGAEPKDAVMVGDSPYDILAGNGAGCTTIAVTWGADSEETVKAAHPDHLVNKIDELESLLFRIMKS